MHQGFDNMLPVVNETTSYWMIPFTINIKIGPCPKCLLKLDLPEASLMLNIYHSLDAIAQHAYAQRLKTPQPIHSSMQSIEFYTESSKS